MFPITTVDTVSTDRSRRLEGYRGWATRLAAPALRPRTPTSSSCPAGRVAATRPPAPMPTTRPAPSRGTARCFVPSSGAEPRGP